MTALSPFLPLPQHTESDAMGDKRPFTASASMNGACSGSGPSERGKTEIPFCIAVVRPEPVSLDRFFGRQAFHRGEQAYTACLPKV